MKSSITQSKEWQKFQDTIGEKSVFKQGTGYQFLAIIKKTPVGNYLYCPCGPVAEDEQSFQRALDTLNDLAREHRAIFIRVEPQNPDFANLLPSSATKTKDLNPKDTWVLDLTQDIPTILTNFSQGTRRGYNTYAKKGLTVESTKDPSEIKYLVALQNKLFKAKNLNTFSADYFKSELEQPFATLYLVRYHAPAKNEELIPNPPADDQVIAALLIFDFDGTRYYMQSAADYEYKKLPATVALVTKAIFDAKEQGIKQFDFWGIAPDGAPKEHPWAGFTKFKKSFGGSAKHYAGTYDIVLHPVKYKLYQSSRKLNRFLRRI